MNERNKQEDRINIAIDGPAGAGKSTVARLVAGRLGYVYVDTGAMYRAVTLAALRQAVDPADGDGVSHIATALDIRLEPGEPAQRVYLNGEDVTDAIRSREVTQSVSQVAAVGAVRAKLVEMQRELASAKGVVMDGRDIGTKVLPDAELKIFLTASVEERARRRFMEVGERQGVTLDTLKREIAERDRMDEQRTISPLTRAPDALMLDSTDLSIEQVADRIAEYGRTKLAEAK